MIDNTVATFEVNPVTFRNNQTVCMAFSEVEQKWSADLCQSTVQPKTYEMQCSCNAFASSYVGVFTDRMRLMDMSVVFPAIEIAQEQSVTVAAPDALHVTGAAEINGTSYVILGVAVLITLFGLSGSSIVMRADMKDWTDLGLAGEFAHADTERFVQEVSKNLNEPSKLTHYRTHALMSYRSLLSSSLFASCLVTIHPLVSPFTSFEATRSRLLRFNAYLLQIIIYAIFCAVYFGSSYRSEDAHRHEEVLD